MDSKCEDGQDNTPSVLDQSPTTPFTSQEVKLTTNLVRRDLSEEDPTGKNWRTGVYIA